MDQLIVFLLLIAATNAKYLGCWVDNTNRAMLLDEGKDGLNTVQSCVDTCTEKGYKYAGLEEGTQCFCGDDYNKHGAADDTECKQACPGNETQMCGGTWRLSVYSAGYVPEPETHADPVQVIKPEIDLAREYIGCFIDKEGLAERAMPEYEENLSTDNSIKECSETCALLEYKYSGTQGGWCYCSDTPDRYSEVHQDDCNIPCPGNTLEECGGELRLSVFTSGYMGYDCSPTGCWADKEEKAMELAANEGKADSTLTIEKCVRACADAGFDYAGLQEGQLCFCGNDYSRYGELNFWDCNSPCAGDTGQICGGTLKNSVFKIHKPEKPTYQEINMDLENLDDFLF